VGLSPLFWGSAFLAGAGRRGSAEGSLGAWHSGGSCGGARTQRLVRGAQTTPAAQRCGVRVSALEKPGGLVTSMRVATTRPASLIGDRHKRANKEHKGGG